MKPAYFHLPTADNDDVALGDAKVLGYVPPTCLLGGFVVWRLIRAEVDPCGTCSGPRARCGGRPKGDDRFQTVGQDAIAEALRDYGNALK